MPAVFLDLVERNQLATALGGIERAVVNSFAEDGSRVTRDEVRRRFCICERLLRQLRGDLHWGLTRVLDHLPRYLRFELDGQPWEPDARSCWMPEDGT